jgi:hypothetical protein
MAEPFLGTRDSRAAGPSIQRVSRSKGSPQLASVSTEQVVWTRACPLTGQTLTPTRGSSYTPEASGRKTGLLQFWHRRPRGSPEGLGDDGVEPGHIPRSVDSDRRVCMLLSFQRPSHLFGRGFLPSGRPSCGFPLLGRTGEYSAESEHRGASLPDLPARLGRSGDGSRSPRGAPCGTAWRSPTASQRPS